jgi:hypothetical protein
MAETPETQQQPQPEAGIVQRYEPPPGAIPIARIKRVGIGLGFLLLAVLTVWGIVHKPEPAATPRNAAAPIQPTTPMEVDSQQAELQREMQEARRAAEQAELAKQRTEHLSADPGAGGPRNAQADPDAQLRTQLRLEELRRQHQAAYDQSAITARKVTGEILQITNRQAKAFGVLEKQNLEVSAADKLLLQATGATRISARQTANW